MRIEPIQPPYEQDIAATLAKWMAPGAAVEPLLLFRLLLRHPKLSERLRPLGAFQLGSGSSLDPRDRELVIHRTCARCGCEYEWGVHAAAFGHAVGLGPEKLAATRTHHTEDPIWTEHERRLIALADSLHDTATISDRLWADLRGHWTETQLLELIVLAGFYHLISFIANAVQLPPEPWAFRFPGGPDPGPG